MSIEQRHSWHGQIAGPDCKFRLLRLAASSQGDPTYLIVTQDGTIEKYGLNAVCTHLGCVVPWVAVSEQD
jgi:Rieske Fe-S protein